jgi:hypothetical protein
MMMFGRESAGEAAAEETVDASTGHLGVDPGVRGAGRRFIVN